MMTRSDITHQRLDNQHIAGTKFETPDAVVRWLGAVQSQDYAGGKWAVGQRMVAATDAALDRAFADGTILRTHVMRPTWHFVDPADIRWLLVLTAPRVNAASAYAFRQLELDDAIFARSNAALIKALQGSVQRTRTELASALEQAGIAADDPRRLTYLMMRAELDGVICSGARRDKQFTYALLDERAPHAITLARDEALAELTTRYFTSHGPATVQDFVWWSGLTTTDAKAGLDMVASHVAHDVVDGKTYWFGQSTPHAPDPSPTAYLLPNYDEYTVGYADRRAVLDATAAATLDWRGNAQLLNNAVVIDGRVVGTWKRTVKKETVIIDAVLSAPLGTDEAHALEIAAERYGRFMSLAAVLRIAQ